MRALVSTLLGEDRSWSGDYESLANDLSHYEKALSEYESFDKKTRTAIIKDLKRDIQATLEGAKGLDRALHDQN